MGPPDLLTPVRLLLDNRLYAAAAHRYCSLLPIITTQLQATGLLAVRHTQLQATCLLVVRGAANFLKLLLKAVLTTNLSC